MTTDIFEDENAVKRHLSEWLTEHGHSIYWEQSNEQYETFSVSGTGGDKPDLLINGNKFTIAVEVKDNEHNSTVYDAHTQTLRYWKQLPEADYIVNGEVVDIDGVVVATQTSDNGHLFTRPDDSPIDHYGDRREDVIERGSLPLVEHSMTEQFIRLLWRHRKVVNASPDAHIGALLSSRLDGRGGTPMVLWSDLPHDSWEVVK